MDVLGHSTGDGDCKCTLRSDGEVSVIGAAGCPVHGMKALRSEVERLRRQPAGAVEALRESAETLHRISTDPAHFDRTFAECQAEYCVKARAALGGQ